jgi:hypothetical protein
MQGTGTISDLVAGLDWVGRIAKPPGSRLCNSPMTNDVTKSREPLISNDEHGFAHAHEGLPSCSQHCHSGIISCVIVLQLWRHCLWECQWVNGRDRLRRLLEA